MVETVLNSNALLGVAFDGDSDRAIFCDENGNLLDGDHILLILSRHLRESGQMHSGCLVTTVMANSGLEVALAKEGIQLVRTRVGDRYVAEEMVRGSHDLGGEPSGHIIFKSQSFSGDGIFSALKVAQIVKEKGSLKNLASGFEKFPQVLVSIPICKKQDFSKITNIQNAIQSAEAALNGEGRVLVRYSGTEVLARIMVEGKRKSVVERHANLIANEFKTALG
jgi:phosphoglucosamine mutase